MSRPKTAPGSISASAAAPATHAARTRGGRSASPTPGTRPGHHGQADVQEAPAPDGEPTPAGSTGQPTVQDPRQPEPGELAAAELGDSAATDAGQAAGAGRDLAVISEVAGCVLMIIQAAEAPTRTWQRGTWPPRRPTWTRHTSRLPGAVGSSRPPSAWARTGRPARTAARSGRAAPARLPGQGLHPASDRQGAGTVLRRGRQRPGQAGQPRDRRTCHRQALQLPARPARRPATSPETMGSRSQVRLDRQARSRQRRPGHERPGRLCLLYHRREKAPGMKTWAGNRIS